MYMTVQIQNVLEVLFFPSSHLYEFCVVTVDMNIEI